MMRDGRFPVLLSEDEIRAAAVEIRAVLENRSYTPADYDLRRALVNLEAPLVVAGHVIANRTRQEPPDDSHADLFAVQDQETFERDLREANEVWLRHQGAGANQI